MAEVEQVAEVVVDDKELEGDKKSADEPKSEEDEIKTKDDDTTLEDDKKTKDDDDDDNDKKAIHEEKPDYGSTEREPLIKSASDSDSKLYLLNNADIRTVFLCILLFSWVIPLLSMKCIDISNSSSCDSRCLLWMIAYCCVLAAILKFVGIIFIQTYFGIDNVPSFIQRLLPFGIIIWSVVLSIGGLFIIFAVSVDLANQCGGNGISCKCGYFAVYLFPALTAFATAFDYIFKEKYGFGNKIRIRICILSSIIFISSLLITIDAFDAYQNETEYVYAISWLLLCISSCCIILCVISGFAIYLKTHCKFIFYTLDIIIGLILFFSISLSMIDSFRLVNMSRTAFLIFSECAVVVIEFNLL